MIEWLLLNAKLSNILAISWQEQINFQWDDDDVLFVLDQHAELDFYSASSLKQQSGGRHIAPLEHIILIPSQCCVLSEEAINTNFIVFGLTWPGIKPTIYLTRGEHANHYNRVLSWYIDVINTTSLTTILLWLITKKLHIHAFDRNQNRFNITGINFINDL